MYDVMPKLSLKLQLVYEAFVAQNLAERAANGNVPTLNLRLSVYDL